MEVDPDMICFDCIGYKECICPSFQVSNIMSCIICGRKNIRIYEKVFKDFDVNKLFGPNSVCFPADIINSYDHEDNVWRCVYRRIHHT